MSYRLTQSEHMLERTASIPASTQLTVCGWFSVAVDRATYTTVFDLMQGADIGYLRFIAFVPGTAFFLNGTSGSTGSFTPGLGTWHYVAWVSGAAATANANQLWYSLAGAGSLTSAVQTTSAAAWTPDRIRVGMDWSTGDWLNGGLYNWKIWSGGTPLTSTQLLAERDSYAPVITSNLWAHYPFLDASTAADDISGNGRTLTVTIAGTTENGGGAPPGAPSAGPPIYDQVGYRWRADDGSLIAP
jgi:hypothetical protein